jgi:membrane protein implicated in regulation of membrane protease activity
MEVPRISGTSAFVRLVWYPDSSTTTILRVTTRTRYFLLQVPGWILAAALLAALHVWAGLPQWVAWLFWVLWVVKDFALYPKLKAAYEENVPTGAAALVGKTGTVRQALEPEGYVEIGAELWQARTAFNDLPIPPGTQVRVLAGEGVVLVVARASEQLPARP